HSMQLVLSQRALEQTPALQTLTVGQVAEINCHKGTKTPSSAIRWYRQRDNEKLERIFTVKRPSPNAKYRENITDDEYRQVLVIKNVQRNDSGTYYCSGQNDSDRSLVFGNGSKIVIAVYFVSEMQQPILSVSPKHSWAERPFFHYHYYFGRNCYPRNGYPPTNSQADSYSNRGARGVRKLEFHSL
uniref:Ig-like domain-containing protein n=1 Tax=Callorhinchus milii TaxID=7868 RepID=A0A4W3GWL1_CALMI